VGLTGALLKQAARVIAAPITKPNVSIRRISRRITDHGYADSS